MCRVWPEWPPPISKENPAIYFKHKPPHAEKDLAADMYCHCTSRPSKMLLLLYCFPVLLLELWRRRLPRRS